MSGQDLVAVGLGEVHVPDDGGVQAGAFVQVGEVRGLGELLTAGSLGLDMDGAAHVVPGGRRAVLRGFETVQHAVVVAEEEARIVCLLKPRVVPSRTGEVPEVVVGIEDGRDRANAFECRYPRLWSAHMKPATAAVADIVRAIAPMDSLEQQHIDLTLAWLASTGDIYRRVKPATPSQHLVSYIALVDPDEDGLYLGMHRLAGLHLPMGGHVDPGEHPLAAARRETVEELGIDADLTVVGDRPLLLTVTPTVGADTHIDVSLWYVIRGSRQRDYTLDPREFDGGQWWDIGSGTIPESDPHLGRFLIKLRAGMPHRPGLDR